MSDFCNVLDKAISEFEEYKSKEADFSKKIIFSAIVSRLWNLRTAYFQELKDNIERKEEEKV